MASRVARRTLLALCTAGALTACGGGGGNSSWPEVTLALRVKLLPQGTLIECQAGRPMRARLARTVDGAMTTSDIGCPSRRALAGDYRLSTWKLDPSPFAESNQATAAVVQASTSLPAPIVLRDGDHMLVLRSDVFASLGSDSPSLERQGPAGEQPLAVAPAGDVVIAGSSPSGATYWRWKTTAAGLTYVSDSVPEHTFDHRDTGQWGPLAASDAGWSGSPHLLGINDYATIGLSAFMIERDFRDIRFADLDNDGHEDVVSNVYGAGCLLVAMAQAGGGYDVRTPTTQDGHCIGGYGETLLVADFDGDGLIDIFIPTYERFYYLKNLGGGQFAEVAQDLGISYPAYQPQPEGAAAIDVDQNGTVDIVVGSEVLLNDGSGHFTPVDHAFGPQGLFDEGMAVADIDGDGRFDVVKNDPTLGPRVYWGAESGTMFVDAGWLFGGTQVSSRAYGLAVGELLDNGRKEIVFAGGEPTSVGVGTTAADDEAAGENSQPPRLCMQAVPRQFTCVDQIVPPLPSGWQDLVMITDVDGDGVDDLVARYGAVQIYRSPATVEHVFRFDLRDAGGHRNMQGHAVRALCADDRSLVGLKAVDGGNGYMAQGNYVVSFRSGWCDSVLLQVPMNGGTRTYGPFAPGLQIVAAGAGVGS